MNRNNKILVAVTSGLGAVTVVFMSLFVWKMIPSGEQEVAPDPYHARITFDASDGGKLEKYDSNQLSFDVEKGTTWHDLHLVSYDFFAMKDDQDFLGWSTDGINIIDEYYTIDENVVFKPVFASTSKKYLTLVPRFDKTEFTCTPEYILGTNVYYSFYEDLSTFCLLNEGEKITASVGQRVFLYSTGSTFSTLTPNKGVVNANKPFTVSGNVNSVVTLGNGKSVSETAFLNAFAYSDQLISAHNLYFGDSVVMGKQCYESMFANDTNLVYAPKQLPNKNLSESCYQEMFSGCIALEKAPILPATNMFDYCYDRMFANCTSLKEAPKLLAEGLAKYCYRLMFNNCSNLKVLSVGFGKDASWPLAEGATYNWLTGVTPSGIFIWKGTTNRADLETAGLLDPRVAPPETETITHIPADWTVCNPS